MSEENRTNFHAVLFTTSLMTAYRESLRGDAAKYGFLFDDHLRSMFVNFTEAINDYVNIKVQAGK